MHSDIGEEKMNATGINLYNPTGSLYGFIGIICIALVGGVILWWYFRTIEKDPNDPKND